jgi:hypothetical protein
MILGDPHNTSDTEAKMEERTISRRLATVMGVIAALFAVIGFITALFSVIEVLFILKQKKRRKAN